MSEAIYVFTFDRIGRHHSVAPLEVPVTREQEEGDLAELLAEHVFRYAKRFTASREVEGVVNLEKMRAAVIVGGFQDAGTATIERRQPAEVAG